MKFVSFLVILSCCFFAAPACCSPCDCLNGGNCINSTCVCTSLWKGINCTTSVCDYECLNQGRCLASGLCSCQPRFEGLGCEITISTWRYFAREYPSAMISLGGVLFLSVVILIIYCYKTKCGKKIEIAAPVTLSLPTINQFQNVMVERQNNDKNKFQTYSKPF